MSVKFAAWIGVFTVISASVLLALAGDINPPAGPVGPTMKTLAQVEPRTPINSTTTPGPPGSGVRYRITRSGSYYLEGDIADEGSNIVIEIVAGHVTVDLMGFALRRTGPGFSSGCAICASGPNLVIRNGSVRGFATGLNTSGANVNVLIENMSLDNNEASNIVTGDGTVVRNCAVWESDGLGIQTGMHCVVSGCVALDNDAQGIWVGDGSSVIDCISSFNQGGILTGSGCAVRDCTVRASYFASGIRVGDNSRVTGCTVGAPDDFSGARGIAGGRNATISDCTVVTRQSGEAAIAAEEGSTVRNCTASSADWGIRVTSSATVAGCTIADSADGILADSDCRLVDNISKGHQPSPFGSGVGIRVTGSGNRIEGNTVNGNRLGLDILGAGNVIIRNMGRANTTSVNIVPGNITGAIVSDEAGLNAASNGNVNIFY